jgi:hypothetical protein
MDMVLSVKLFSKSWHVEKGLSGELIPFLERERIIAV